jgi:hypothetical protein
MREKLKNKSWLFLIWEIIKKITHYYFNKNSFKQWEKIGTKKFKEPFSELIILFLSEMGY